MKKSILFILLVLTIITTLPSNSFSFDRRHPRRHKVVVIHKWPRHHVVVVYHRHHRHHRYRRLPPIWIPRDPWR